MEYSMKLRHHSGIICDSSVASKIVSITEQSMTWLAGFFQKFMKVHQNTFLVIVQITVFP